MAKKIVWSDEARADVRAIDRAGLPERKRHAGWKPAPRRACVQFLYPFYVEMCCGANESKRYRCTKITAFNGDETPRIVAITGTSPFGAETGTCTFI